MCEGTPYTTSPSTLSTAPVAVTIRIGPDEGSPSRSPTTSTRSKDGRAADQRSGTRSDGGGPPALDTHSVPYSIPAVTFSFRFGKGRISSVMSPCLQHQVHLNSVSIQLSVFIYIISVSLHAFLVVFVVFECVIAF